MLKVFAFIGSRRTGNTLAAARLFLDAMQAQMQQPIDITLYTAADLNPAPCLGCASCFSTGKCVRDPSDHFGDIREQMLAADLIVLASPVYAHGVSGDMKIFIDRISSWLHLFRLAGKKSVVISTSSNNGNEIVNSYLVKMLEYLGTEVIADLSVTVDGPRMLEDKMFLNAVLPDIARRAAGKLAAGGFSSSPRQEGYFKMMRQAHLNNSKGYESVYWHESKLCSYESLNEYIHAEIIRKDTVSE